MHLNLARKWRSKHFDELVGQPLVVRLVKNSLYRNLIFPVYLLSGTRGCGKTSVARIFAAALNCETLDAFQKNPQTQQLPCLACVSCKAMQSMNHPDFIEIDAASHTGVDNVRAIIEAASFVPVMGKKKIYLIDEAHMLSKAAFNAFLKILEEPPASVVFMLATTDPHKILETVTSRCFQLFFNPIDTQTVVQHLGTICTQEGLGFEPDALTLIAQETEGSLRDALNLIERVRIAYPEITKKSVIELLGKIDDERLYELLKVVLEGSVAEVVATIEKLELENYNPVVVWKSFVEMIRLSLWVKNGVKVQNEHAPLLRELLSNQSVQRLIKLFEICYEYELSFAKTATPRAMLEMMLLKMATAKDSNTTTGAKKVDPASVTIPTMSQKGTGSSTKAFAIKNTEKGVTAQPNSTEPSSHAQGDRARKTVSVSEQEQKVEQPLDQSPWAQCVRDIEKLNDPLVVSIFKQGIVGSYNEQTNVLEIIFSQDLLFFKEWLENTQKIWHPSVARIFGEGVTLIPHFTGAPKERVARFGPAAQPITPVKKADGGEAQQQGAHSQRAQLQGSQPQGAQPQSVQGAMAAKPTTATGPKNRQRVVTISDPEKWQKAHALLRIFPGTLTVNNENSEG